MKYEYVTFGLDDVALNQYGEAGWRVVQVIPPSKDVPVTTVLMERQKYEHDPIVEALSRLEQTLRDSMRYR